MITFKNGVFRCDDINEAKKCGMRWSGEIGAYVSKDWLPVALTGLQFCDWFAELLLCDLVYNYRKSSCLSADVEIPKRSSQTGDYLPFQKAGIMSMSGRKAALLGDEPGLGKTIQAIGVANLNQWETFLIICPASLRRNWKQEILKWSCLEDEIPFLIESSKDIPPQHAKIIIVNYDFLVSPNLFRCLKSRRFDGIIFDEAHYLKNSRQRMDKATRKLVPMSKRTKACIMRGGLIENADQAIFITGTSIKKRTKEIFSLCKAGCPEIMMPFQDYQSFGVKFCKGFRDRRRGNTWNFEGSSNLDELNFRLRSGFMIRREKKDVLPQLPPKTLKIVPIPAGCRAVRDLIEEEKGLIEYASDSDFKLAKGTEPGRLEQLRQELGIAKLPIVIEYVKNILETQDKILVIAHNREIIRLLNEAFESFGVVCIQGGMSGKAKDEAVRRFMEDPECRVFNGQIQAAGVGLTLTTAYTVVLAQTCWVPGDIDQVLDRCHRIGQNMPVTGHILAYEDSLEEYMLKSVGDAIGNIKQTMRNDLI